jgi:GNAT superfamily N-acetyltransferase
LEITGGRIVDPEVWKLLQEAGVAAGERGERDFPALRVSSFPVVLTARREDEVVGVATAWRSDDGGHVAVVVAPGTRRQGIGGTLLSHMEAAIRGADWRCPHLKAHGPRAFYEARSAWSVPSD